MVTKRAQAWGFDLIIAAVIAISGLIIVYAYINNIAQKESPRFDDLKKDAERLAVLLLEEGIPENWTRENVVKIGITTNNKIDERKLEEFYNISQTDYSIVKKMFRINSNYFINFTEPIIINQNYVQGIGLEPVNPQQIIKATRFVVYKGKPTTIRVIIWE